MSTMRDGHVMRTTCWACAAAQPASHLVALKCGAIALYTLCTNCSSSCCSSLSTLANSKALLLLLLLLLLLAPLQLQLWALPLEPL